MNHAKEALAILTDEIGVREVPNGSNSGPRVRQYQAATWLPGTGWPWCAAAVCWAYEQAGHPLPDPSAGAKDLVDRAVRKGWGVSVPVTGASPGDLVAFNVGSGHIGLFKSYNPKTKMLTTVDGNVSNMVAARTRHTSTVYRVVRVKETHPSKPKPKGPIRQVVTAEDGKEVVVYASRNLDKVLGRFERLVRSGAKSVTVRRK